MTALVVTLAVVVAVQSFLLIGLLRSHGTILRRLHDLGAGLDGATSEAGAPPAGAGAGAASAGVVIEGRTPDGETVALDLSQPRQDVLLLFLSSTCKTCDAFWRALAAGPLAGTEDHRVVVVTQGDEHELPAEVARLAPAGTSVIMSSDTWARLAVPGSPYVVHVEARTGRVVGSGTGQDWEQVRQLLDLGRADAGGGPRSRRGARREAAMDAELMRAGIHPGDPSLYGADADSRSS